MLLPYELDLQWIAAFSVDLAGSDGRVDRVTGYMIGRGRVIRYVYAARVRLSRPEPIYRTSYTLRFGII